jgi:hypothetical protein
LKCPELLSKLKGRTVDAVSLSQATSTTNNKDGEGSEAGDKGRPIGRKKAKRKLDKERESLAESGRIMAEESRR